MANAFAAKSMVTSAVALARPEPPKPGAGVG
jgi:hypothetical protein